MSAERFRPLPGLGNPHLQTVLSMVLKGGRLPRTRQHLVTLPDSDRLVLHDNTPRAWQPGQPVSVVLHGLTGSHRSGGVVMMARQLYRRGVRVFRLDFRGAGAGFALARGSYNAGCSDDVRHACAEVSRLAPGSQILLAGTSLGGNVALKLAGELPTHPVPHLTRVAVLNPPIDLHACVARIESRSNRLYEWHFVAELLAADRKRATIFSTLPPGESARRLRLREYDDRYTALRAGYQGVADYYTRASSAQFVPYIPIPTLMLTSRDDPFIAIEPFESVQRPPHVELWIANHGGHTGYLGRHTSGGWHWAENTIADWLCVGIEKNKTP